MTQPAPLTTVTLPVLRAMLDYMASKDYHHGVLGVRAQPRWDGPAHFTHDGTLVDVLACTSALAVREALLDRRPENWLVVITDRDHDDLGAGILSHFVGNRARQPDEWQALRQRFNATDLDPAFFNLPSPRQIATALLAVEPNEGWSPAPGGVLTVQHAMAALAERVLGVADELDGAAVLAWSEKPETAALVAHLRATGGNELTDVVLDWVAQLLGAAREPVLALLRAGRFTDIVPIGLALDALTSPSLSPDVAQIAREALIRLEPVLGNSTARLEALRPLAAEALGYLRRQGVERGPLLARADALIADLQAAPVAEMSAVLPAGYRARTRQLAEAIRRAASRARSGHDGDAALIDPSAAHEVETLWQLVSGHLLADADRDLAAWAASVRLVRWLALPTGTGGTLDDLVQRHVDVDAWVDVALNDAAAGTAAFADGMAIESLLAVVRRRRDAHDEQFAQALAAVTSGDAADSEINYIEDVLPRYVVPIARAHEAGVLFLVLDGMSAAVATEVISDAVSQGWFEAMPASCGTRLGALAALPTITAISRTSLLCGTLTSGRQPEEIQGFATLANANGLSARLFHKKLLDTTRPGFRVADDVGAAIDDISHRLVACVLNTVDDALDRSNPAETTWTLDQIRHLRPLLERARAAGRIVILTADHGHIVERREGTQRPHSGISSGRSRPDDGTLDSGEIRIAGRRVLAHEGRAILAFDERLRYGPLKAGYHGGASPAEAVVPVLFLLPPAVALPQALQHTSRLTPTWWDAPATTQGGIPATAAPAAQPQGVLFAHPSAGDTRPDSTPPLSHQVLTSQVYAAQRQLAGRATPSDDRIAALIDAAASAPGTRVLEEAAAALLGVGPASVRGAVAAVQRLLNVEGYEVLDYDADGRTLVLDVPLLREQFGVRA